MIELNTENFFTYITEPNYTCASSTFNLPVIVDFFAPWCAPCMRMMVILPNLEKDLYGKAYIAKIDCVANPELKTMYEITAYPTFVFFVKGREVDRILGVPLLKELREKTEQLYENWTN